MKVLIKTDFLTSTEYTTMENFLDLIRSYYKDKISIQLYTNDEPID